MIDLHVHLDGSLSARCVASLAEMCGKSLPTDDETELASLLSVKKSCKSLSEYLEKFTLPLSVLQSAQTIEGATYYLQSRLFSDGLCYAEIRFAPQLHTAEGLSQREVVLAAIRGLDRGISENKMKAQLILCCMRGGSVHENSETVALAAEFLGRGVCAVDLAGDEAKYPTKDFADIFKQARASGVPFTIHAGEADGVSSVKSALDLGALRIGHGTRSAEDKSLLSELRDKKTVLEVCFSSNIQTKSVTDEKLHPLPQFIKKGIAVTINTDNMTVSDTTLKKEYLTVKNKFSLSNYTLKKLALVSAESAFVTPEVREELTAEINSRFDSWIEA